MCSGWLFCFCFFYFLQVVWRARFDSTYNVVGIPIFFASLEMPVYSPSASLFFHVVSPISMRARNPPEHMLGMSPITTPASASVCAMTYKTWSIAKTGTHHHSHRRRRHRHTRPRRSYTASVFARTLLECNVFEPTDFDLTMTSLKHGDGA